MFAVLHAQTREDVLTRLTAVAVDMTPRWERLSPRAVVLDVSGLRHIVGSPDDIAEAARGLAQAQGLDVCVALAPTWTAALVLATAGVQTVVPPGGVAAALAPLPVDALAAIPGVDLVETSVLPGPPRVRRLGSARNYRLSAGLGLVADAMPASSGPAQSAPSQSAPSQTAPTPTARAASGPVVYASRDVVVPPTTPATSALVAPADASPIPNPSGRPWPDVLATLQRWGITTCGALARLPAADLQARLGDRGPWLQRMALGHDPRPMRAQPPDEVFVQGMELEWPIDGLEPLSFVLGRVLDPLCAHLEARDRAAVVVRLTLRLTDRTVHERAIELPVPVRDTRVLRTLLLLDLEAHPPQAAVDRLTVAVDPIAGRIVQFSLLRKALPSNDQLAALLARLTALMGEGRCGAPALVDSYRPGDVGMAPFTPDGTEGHDTGPEALLAALGVTATRDAGRARSGECEPAREGWLDSAGYHVRRLRQPWPVEVVTTGGRTPRAIRFGLRRRDPQDAGFRDGAIVQAAGPWRSSGAWWQPSTDHDGAWDRDEWDIALETGAAYRVFQDRTTGRWWVEGEID